MVHVNNRKVTIKKCPFCVKGIQDDILTCKHCGEFLHASNHPHFEEEKVPWYFREYFVGIAIGCVGPLALPQLWWCPQKTLAWKIGITIGLLLVLGWMFWPRSKILYFGY